MNASVNSDIHSPLLFRHLSAKFLSSKAAFLKHKELGDLGVKRNNTNIQFDIR